MFNKVIQMNKKKIGFLINFLVILCSFSINFENLMTPNIQAFPLYPESPKWSIPFVMSDQSNQDSTFSSVAVDYKGNVHIAWQDDSNILGSGSDWDIFYRYWDTSSSAWSDIEVVSSESTGNSMFVEIAVDSSGDAHFVWNDDTSNIAGSGSDRDICYKSWDSSTSSFTTLEIVSSESTDQSWHASLAIDISGNIYVVWEDETNYDSCGSDDDIFYKFWNKTTSSWTLTEVVSTESTSISMNPSIDVDSFSNVYVVWSDHTDYAGAGAEEDIFYKKRISITSSWTITEVLSYEGTVQTTYPDVVVDLIGNVHAVYIDSTNLGGNGGDFDIFYKRWNYLTSTWTEVEVLSAESNGHSLFPKIEVLSAFYVHVIWCDETNYFGVGTDRDIFYKYWNVATASWSTPAVVSIESTAESRFPALALANDGSIHAVWEDKTNYNNSGSDFDIFYKRYAYPLSTPELAPILPYPSNTDTAFLDWNDIYGVKQYYIFRSSEYIWSTESLIPIAITTSSNYSDIVETEGVYYYSIVACDKIFNSSHSNCQFFEYKLPHVQEIIKVFSILGGLAVIFFTVAIVRKRNKTSF